MVLSNVFLKGVFGLTVGDFIAPSLQEHCGFDEG